MKYILKEELNGEAMFMVEAKNKKEGGIIKIKEKNKKCFKIPRKNIGVLKHMGRSDVY